MGNGGVEKSEERGEKQRREGRRGSEGDGEGGQRSLMADRKPPGS